MATFIAATVPVENKGDVNELMESAKRIGLTDEQFEILARRDADEKGKAAPGTSKPAVAEPKTGSYEAFMATFGRVAHR